MDLIQTLDLTNFLLVLQMIPMIVMAWIGVIAFWGLVKHRRPKAVYIKTEQNNFGIIVCAHNEETSISHLLDSIDTSDYPHEKIHVFLIADHCTDRTADIGRSYPFVTVMERNEGPQDGKGSVLKWALPRIFSLDKENKIGAFAVFDADNVLKPDFLTKIDDKLRRGNRIVQGNRLGGQPYRSFVTKWYTLYWACYTIFFSYAREKVGLSVFLTGTGFAVDGDLLRQIGWNTSTITEDVEFSLDNVLRGQRVSFCIKAVCYDEQPHQIGVMFHQLARWCTGGYQVLKKDFKSLVFDRTKPVRKMQRVDAVMLLLMGPCSWISAIISYINNVIIYLKLPLLYFLPAAGFTTLSLIFMYFAVFFTAKYNHIPMRKIGILPILTFPLFLFVYMLCSIKTCFFPTRKWTTIKHEALNTAQ
ncbi:MAG: glycosyltransferase family 2 protein [Lachnospiraceae bacterium]|nr:glycosyltransferase family 2 protein [Lachnospiraceae bacterium]